MFESMHRVSMIALANLAMEIETTVENFYTLTETLTTDTKIKIVLKALAKQEIAHRNQFSEFLEKVRKEAEEHEKDKKLTPVMDVLKKYFPELYPKVKTILDLKENTAEATRIAKNPSEFLEFACDIERTTSEFYEAIQRHLSNHHLRKLAEELVNVEKGHLKDFLSIKAKIQKAVARRNS